MQPKRVLHFQGRMGKGGAETFMMNVYRNIDRSKVQFDFLIYNDFKNITPYHEEIQKLGGRIFSVPNPKKNIIGYISEVNKILKNEKIDIVHSEVFFGGGLNVYLAKKAGIKERIVHSHATSKGKKNTLLIVISEWIFKKMMYNSSTMFLACSKDAGHALFGMHHPFVFVPNGIDLEKYKTSIEIKEKVKKDLGIPDNSLVIGNIGRFEKQKNHDFLIDIFQSVLSQNDNAHLVLIGEGTLRENIESKVKRLGIEKRVHILGVQDDVSDFLKVMDIFLMPSLYEGLPISAIEAQASGLKTILSDQISLETKVSKNVSFISLNNSPDEWAKVILRPPYTNHPLERMQIFDMHQTAALMEKVYMEKL